MTALIKRENDIIVAPEVAKELVEFERLQKEIEKKEKEIKDTLLAAMKEAKLLSIRAESENGSVLITYIDGYDRETFDSKSFREQHPDVYDAYVKMSKVKPTIRLKLE